MIFHMIIAYLKKSLSCAWNEIGQNINLRNGQDSHSQLFPPGTEKTCFPPFLHWNASAKPSVSRFPSFSLKIVKIPW